MTLVGSKNVDVQKCIANSVAKHVRLFCAVVRPLYDQHQQNYKRIMLMGTGTVLLLHQLLWDGCHPGTSVHHEVPCTSVHCQHMLTWIGSYTLSLPQSRLRVAAVTRYIGNITILYTRACVTCHGTRCVHERKE